LHNEVVYHTIALYLASGHLRASTDTWIGDGFTYDNQTPIPIDTWCQPGNPGPGCHSDRHCSLHWTVQ